MHLHPPSHWRTLGAILDPFLSFPKPSPKTISGKALSVLCPYYSCPAALFLSSAAALVQAGALSPPVAHQAVCVCFPLPADHQWSGSTSLLSHGSSSEVQHRSAGLKSRFGKAVSPSVCSRGKCFPPCSSLHFLVHGPFLHLQGHNCTFLTFLTLTPLMHLF